MLFACAASALAAWGSDSLLIALVAALAAGLLASWFCERTLRAVIDPIAQIAAGDRYAALPERRVFTISLASPRLLSHVSSLMRHCARVRPQPQVQVSEFMRLSAACF